LQLRHLNVVFEAEQKLVANPRFSKTLEDLAGFASYVILLQVLGVSG
jgi:hypothetical protein